MRTKELTIEQLQDIKKRGLVADDQDIYDIEWEHCERCGRIEPAEALSLNGLCEVCFYD